MTRLIALLLLSPTAALAHPGPHATASLLHLLSEPDHLAMIALGVAVAVFAAAKVRAGKLRSDKIRARR